MTASLHKAVGQLEGRMQGVEADVIDVKDTLKSIDKKLDHVIVQIAVARVRNEKSRKRYGRIMAIASGVGTAIAAFFIKWKGVA